MYAIFNVIVVILVFTASISSFQYSPLNNAALKANQGNQDNHRFPGHLIISSSSASFLSNTRSVQSKRQRLHSWPLLASNIDGNEMKRDLEAAKQLIRKAKEKINAKEKEKINAKEEINAKDKLNKGDKNKIKKVTDKGVVADSEVMLEESDNGEWTNRPMSSIFVNEISDPSSKTSDEDPWSKIRERDAAQTVMGLRKTLNKEDFDKIFDDRNPRIGKQ